MSNTLSKSLILSQPKVGQLPETYATPLTHEITREEEFIVVKVEVPGVDPSTIDVHCENNILGVTCPRGEMHTPVDPTIDISKIEADIQWGLLTLTIPAPAAPPSRAIKVKVHKEFTATH